MYELIKETGLPDAKAEALVEEIEKLLNQKFDDRKEHLATKEDVANAKTDLTKDLANAKTELTRSIYVASIAQILTILGGLFGILKLMQVI